MNKIMNNRLFFLLFFLLGMLFCGTLNAQTERSKEITTVGGKEYYMHHVKSGESLWGISKLYNVSIEEIETMNPEVKKGLKAGHVLGIPVRPFKETTAEPEEPAAPKEEPKPMVVEPEPVLEPEPEPVVEPEPIPEPIAIEPEPIAVEPEPEPIVEPEPVVVEPEPEPEPVIAVPEPEPVAVEPIKVTEEPRIKEEQVAVRPDNKAFYDGKARIVQAGETIYDIAKEYGVDLADLRAVNPGLSEEPTSGTRIIIPAIVNDNDYIIHHCERNERVSSLLKRWKVDEDDFRRMNVSVGSHVFVNQVVLIPIQPMSQRKWLKTKWRRRLRRWSFPSRKKPR